jgi:hypothetical protein
VDQVGKICWWEVKGPHLGFAGTLIEIVSHTLVSHEQDCWANACLEGSKHWCACIIMHSSGDGFKEAVELPSQWAPFAKEFQ